MNVLTRRSLEFGPYRLDLLERILLRNGEAVPLAPKLFETLVFVVENGGHILENDDLLDWLWRDTFVAVINLAQNIFQLRRALANGANENVFIETIPKRGYRFTAEVTRTDYVPSSYHRHTGCSTIEAEQPGITIKSLAVLPFQLLS